MKRGIDLVGEAANNYSGFSVSMPVLILRVAAIFNSQMNGIKEALLLVRQMLFMAGAFVCTQYCITEIPNYLTM